MTAAAMFARLHADPNPARIEGESLSIGGRRIDAMFYNLPGLLALIGMRGLA